MREHLEVLLEKDFEGEVGAGVLATPAVAFQEDDLQILEVQLCAQNKETDPAHLFNHLAPLHLAFPSLHAGTFLKSPFQVLTSPLLEQTERFSKTLLGSAAQPPVHQLQSLPHLAVRQLTSFSSGALVDLLQNLLGLVMRTTTWAHSPRPQTAPWKFPPPSLSNLPAVSISAGPVQAPSTLESPVAMSAMQTMQME